MKMYQVAFTIYYDYLGEDYPNLTPAEIKEMAREEFGNDLEKKYWSEKDFDTSIETLIFEEKEE